jgi:hypothetical protein
MKDHVPIKRHSALVPFSKDHHFALLLIWKTRQGLAKAIAPERIANYVLYFFDADLKSHFDEEERRIFSKLAPDNVLRQQAEKEHSVIYEMIEKLRNNKGNEKLLMEFAETLQNHIRFEERELFAFIQQNLPDDELEAIRTHDESSGIKTEPVWQDVFW